MGLLKNLKLYTTVKFKKSKFINISFVQKINFLILKVCRNVGKVEAENLENYSSQLTDKLISLVVMATD